jgi:hypothetical protein
MKSKRVMAVVIAATLLVSSSLVYAADDFKVPEHKLADKSGITVQAEDYDNGGEGVGFHDTDTKNEGGAYRQDGVDVGAGSVDGSDKGLDVGWTNADEWLNYSVDVEKAGTYDFDMFVASPNSEKQIIVKVDGTEAFTADIPNTGDWQKYQIVSNALNLKAGKNVIQLYLKNGGANIDKFTLAAAGYKVLPEHKFVSGATLYVQAENYDNGGEGVGFHDTDTKNEGGSYRKDGVDVGAGSVDGSDKGLDVGWTNGDEWLNYTVDVEKEGTYFLTLYVASPNSEKQIIVKADGTEAFTADVPNTGDWQKYQGVSNTLKLKAGKNVIQLYLKNGGANIDKFLLSVDKPAPLAPPVPEAKPIEIPDPVREPRTFIKSTVKYDLKVNLSKAKNIAPQAVATSSTTYTSEFPASAVTDGVKGKIGAAEWISDGEETPWICLDWSAPVTINKIVINDGANLLDNAIGGTLIFSDGSKIKITGIDKAGKDKVITFSSRSVKWIEFDIQGAGTNVGLSEIAVYGAKSVPAKAPVVKKSPVKTK